VAIILGEGPRVAPILPHDHPIDEQVALQSDEAPMCWSRGWRRRRRRG
jgi:hypothetical protein